MAERERSVEAHLVKRMEEIGLRVYKFVPEQAPGMPDRLVLLPDRQVLWVELKRPKGGRLSELQLYRHHELRKAGHQVAVVWTKGQADTLVAKTAELLQRREQGSGARATE